MDRSIKTGNTAPRLALAVSTALVSLALAGCATSAAPRGDVSFASAQAALTKGQVDQAVAHAEAAVMAEPRNPGFRALLGAAYLENGRFQSAATSFGDALDLSTKDRIALDIVAREIEIFGRDVQSLFLWDDLPALVDWISEPRAMLGNGL